MSEEARAEAMRERRLNPGAAHELLVQFYPDEEVRKLCKRFLADSIQLASQHGPSKWSLSLRENKKRIQLNVGRLLAVRLKAREVVLSIESSGLKKAARAFLKEHGVERIHFQSEPDLRGYSIPAERLAEALTHLQEAHQRFTARAADGVRQTPLYRFHSPCVLEYLEKELGKPLPRPSYEVAASGDEEEEELESSEVIEDIPEASETAGGFSELKNHLQAKGLHFSDELVSHYLLALQTRRFVILTGISGTGKTRLAIETAEWARSRMRRPEEPVGAVRVRREPYMTDHRRIALPVALQRQLDLGSEVPPPKRTLFPGQMNLAGQLPGQSDFSDIQGQDAGDTANPSLTVSFGTQLVETRVWKERDRNVAYLPLRPKMLEWFEAHVRPDSDFFLEAVDAEKGPSRHLRIIVPGAPPESLDSLAVVAVRPDWTDPRGLLGHYNPLTRRYSTTPFLERMLAAAREAERAQQGRRSPRPFFIILDEMNLARVEHYFSDFLSCLESDEPLHLHSESGEGTQGVLASDGSDGLTVPRELRIPKNVFFTGTVNVDETTFTFSPKVLDRAFVIEFNDVDLRSYGGDSPAREDTSFRLTQLPGELDEVRTLARRDWEELGALANGQLREVLVQLHELLAQDLRHFGYRVANEMARFLSLAARQTDGSSENLNVALDLVILSKVLSRLHGTQQELEGCLTRLFAFLIHGTQANTADRGAFEAWDWRREKLVPVKQESAASEPVFPRSSAKVWRMLRRLRQHGFTSFIE